ncbi:hypothetical protein NLU13_7432 [Sarocladium strictum]|uniref:Uncharacterized protein n=1 Tax=Sarocladium strictum TaxID=5046 RepID=A0AA39GE99_SARSR|nr:hypothetical protein NLU13_7432 [Sarocladium strictum]
MAQHSDASREPLRTNDDPHSHLMSSRISSWSDISSIDTNPYDPPSPPPLRPRESLVSLDSQNVPAEEDIGHGTSYPGARHWNSSRALSRGGSYTPVGGRLSRAPSSRSSLHSPLRALSRPERINEEEYDMSLLSAAAPIDGALDPISPAPAFDLSAGMWPQEEDFQDQEARGTLTGGLGEGWIPEARVRHDELLSSPVVEGSLSRSISRRFGSRRLNRARALRDMGQDEANRRGEVIEVIMEEPADLSLIEGPSTLTVSDRRGSTFPTRRETTQIFYPQPNWKPFSMRFPWLCLLVLVSIGLAVMQEVLYRRYHDTGILRFKSPDDVKPALYFAVKFGPTLAAVVYGVLWQFTDFEVRRLEAYYQLSKPGGALAAESINVDYVTCFTFFRPIRALKCGHHAVAVSSIATTLAISLVPTFAAASIVLTPSRQERIDEPDREKVLHLTSAWSRLLTSVLCFCAFSGIALFWLLQKRRSGLQADVRGIAGLASMAVVSHVLMDFKGMDQAKHKEIHHRLKNHRYILRNLSLAPDDENPLSSQDREKYANIPLSENPHPLMLRTAGIIPFFFSLVLFMGFIPVFLFTKADVVTAEAPWFVTVLAVCLKLAWHGMETAVRMMEPYYILSRRHAPSKTLTLDYTALPFGYLPLRALFNGHLLMFMVGFGTVMAEFLTVLVTGLATVEGRDFLLVYGKDDDDGESRGLDAGTETVHSFLVSLALTLFILLYMSIITFLVFLRRRHPFLPRQPNTIASVLAFIHQSKMLYDFVGTTKMGSSETAKHLEGKRDAEGKTKTYGLGWFEGRDGLQHLGVDQEELIGNYKHGRGFHMGNQPWNERWDEY